MRYQKEERLLNLVFFFQSDSEGRSLSEIMEEFEVSRRTAERMRDAVERVFPQLEEVESFDRNKRWRIPSQIPNGLIRHSPEELASLEFCVGMLERQNLVAHAEAVNGVLNKVRASIRPADQSRLEPDIEALTEAEGLAMRPGPKLKPNTEHLSKIRTAILMQQNIKILVEFRGTGKKGSQLVSPYGFLYGTRNYLVAKSARENSIRLYSLSNIEKVVTTGESFVRDPEFSLKEYAERSFGVFQEEPVDVCWKFSPRAAADAKEFVFHPSQTTEELDDGSLLVRFRAGGIQEMKWHLYTWGADVEVVKGAH